MKEESVYHNSKLQQQQQGESVIKGKRFDRWKTIIETFLAVRDDVWQYWVKYDKGRWLTYF
jgi:hypothetical protein